MCNNFISDIFQQQAIPPSLRNNSIAPRRPKVTVNSFPRIEIDKLIELADNLLSASMEHILSQIDSSSPLKNPEKIIEFINQQHKDSQDAIQTGMQAYKAKMQKSLAYYWTNGNRNTIDKGRSMMRLACIPSWMDAFIYYRQILRSFEHITKVYLEVAMQCRLTDDIDIPKPVGFIPIVFPFILNDIWPSITSQRIDGNDKIKKILELAKSEAMFDNIHAQVQAYEEHAINIRNVLLQCSADSPPRADPGAGDHEVKVHFDKISIQGEDVAAVTKQAIDAHKAVNLDLYFNVKNPLNAADAGEIQRKFNVSFRYANNIATSNFNYMYLIRNE